MTKGVAPEQRQKMSLRHVGNMIWHMEDSGIPPRQITPEEAALIAENLELKLQRTLAPESQPQPSPHADLLCPVHASLDARGQLKPLDNCMACIRNERDELRETAAPDSVSREELAAVLVATDYQEMFPNEFAEFLQRHFIISRKGK